MTGPPVLTIDRGRQLLKVQADWAGHYSDNSATPILSEIMREHGQQAVGRLLVELELTRTLDSHADTHFHAGLALDPARD